MMKTSVIVAAAAAAALGGPALAKTHKSVKHPTHVGHAAQAPTGWSGPPAGWSSSAPQFIRVGPNGYWVTTTWGCWTDEGQGRIHDCEMDGNSP